LRPVGCACVHGDVSPCDLPSDVAHRVLVYSEVVSNHSLGVSGGETATYLANIIRCEFGHRITSAGSHRAVTMLVVVVL
jgi:hypothetical protein